MSDQHSREISIFLAAIETKGTEELRAYLNDACGDDRQLRTDVEALLVAHLKDNSFLEHPIPAVAQTIDLNLNALDAGLAATFGPDAAVVIGNASHSVLKSLSKRLSNTPTILLRENGEAESRVVQLGSKEFSTKQTNNRYQLHGEIARGGMGAIIKGRDTDLGRDLAIKVLLDEHKDKPEMLQRFVEEAQIGGQLQHPGIVPVYELGLFNDERPFFSMKLVKGDTLAELLAVRKKPQDNLSKLLGIFEQVCQAMAYAHSKGVVHRDLKPANIMIGAFGEVQVMDWGLSKVLSKGGVADERKSIDKHRNVSVIQTRRSVGSDVPGEGGSNTQLGSVMGTPAYMPPEQALGEIDRLDERADVFGLGAILAEILSGKPPYVANDATQVFRMACRGKLDECFARLDASGADAELIALTISCLAPESVDRPKDAQAVAEALTAYLDGLQERSHKAELAEAEARARAIEEAKRRRLTLALAGTVLAAMTLGGGSWLWIKADRDARMAQVTRDFNSVLNKAVSLREQAKVAHIGSAELFSQAREQTQRALAIVQSGPADEALAQQVASLQTELDEEQKDRQLIAALDEARLAQAELATEGARFAWEKAVPLFREAFHAYGLPVGTGDPGKAAERIRQRPAAVREAIFASLEDWGILIDNPTYGVKEPHREWMLAVLDAAEPEEAWGRQVRTAITEKDLEKRRTELEKLRMSVDIRKVPAASLLRFARQLAPEQKVELLVRSQAHYPADFWINFDLGTSLTDGTPPDYAEAVRFLTAAVALQPECTAAHSNLGLALNNLGQQDSAISQFEKAIELAPNLFAHLNLGKVLWEKGSVDEAIACYKKAIALNPKFAKAHYSLGMALQSKKQVDEAIECYKKA